MVIERLLLFLLLLSSNRHREILANEFRRDSSFPPTLFQISLALPRRASQRVSNELSESELRDHRSLAIGGQSRGQEGGRARPLWIRGTNFSILPPFAFLSMPHDFCKILESFRFDHLGCRDQFRIRLSSFSARREITWVISDDREK